MNLRQAHCYWGARVCGIFLVVGALPVSAQMCGQQKLTAEEVEKWEQFGYSVSVNGDRVVVGVPNDRNAGVSTSGSAYVFRRHDNGTPSDVEDDLWVKEFTLVPSIATHSARFGSSVAIDGEWIIVGAFRDNLHGSAYIFRRFSNGWGELAKLVHPDIATTSNFGTSVSISGDRVIVGAPNDDEQGWLSGSAFIFRQDDNGTPPDPTDDGWIQESKLIASDTGRTDSFGCSVSINGDRAVVGAKHHGEGWGDTGTTYVFRRDDNGTAEDPTDDVWVQEAELIPADRYGGDESGTAVSISGDRVITGAPHNDGVAKQAGAAYVFRRDDNGSPSDPTDDSWVEEARLTASDAVYHDQFGSSVSISGDRAVVGTGVFIRTAYVFQKQDNGTPLNPSDDYWLQEAKITTPDSDVGILHAVSIDGEWVVSGSPGDDSVLGESAGSAHVFDMTRKGTPCDDGDACTVNDALCDATCAGTPTTCDDGDVCTFDSCDSVTGCANTPTPDASCDEDNRACTVGVCECFSGRHKICDCNETLHCQLFGDVFPPGPPQGDCTIDLDDILHELAAFGDAAPCSNYPGTDLFPCDATCAGVDLDDIMVVLASFGGDRQCPDPCPY